MKKYFSIIVVLIFVFIAISGTAHADNNFSLHIEQGLVQPLTAPQSDLYHTGAAFSLKGLFAVDPHFAIGPSTSFFYLPRAIDNGQNAGVLWQVGGTVRVQTDRRNTSSDKIYPWIDSSLSFGVTGNLMRPALDVGLGAELPLDENHIAWIGPYVRYTHVFQTSDTQDPSFLDSRDVNMLQIGLSVSFDTPTTPRTKVKRVVEERKVVVREPGRVVVIHSLPMKIPVDRLNLSEKVYFDHDSATLRWESRDKLDEVVKQLNAHRNLIIKVQGYASVDGQLAYNVKLSEKRTQSVVNYLIAHGISAVRLKPVSLGVANPAAPNTTKEGRERNRRVEFTVNFISLDGTMTLK